VSACAAAVPVLEWRRDVGDEGYLNGLSRLVEDPLGVGGQPRLYDGV
jgi:hypothetical protein